MKKLKDYLRSIDLSSYLKITRIALKENVEKFFI